MLKVKLMKGLGPKRLGNVFEYMLLLTDDAWRKLHQ